jgi:hypothetical protein
MEPSFWCICRTKNWQKWIKSKNIIALQNKGVVFTKKKVSIQFIAYFQLLKKSLNIILMPLELQDDL